MAEKLESTKYFILSLGDIEILIDYAEKARDNQDDDHRKLFMKLSIVSIVTKFQVFIESLLQEILHKLRTERIKYSSIPMQLVLNSLKISSEDSLCKKIEKQSSFQEDNYETLKSTFNSFRKHFLNNSYITNELKLKCKFPMGKTGSGELIKLFYQFENKNIFESFDINTLDALLNIRHNIVHQDATPSITETTVSDYLFYIKNLSRFIDKYIYKLLFYENGV